MLSNHHTSILCCLDSHTLSQFSLTSSSSFCLFLTWGPGCLPIRSILNLHSIIWIISWNFSFCGSPLLRFFHSICNFFVLLVLISHTHFNNPIPVIFLFLFSFQCTPSKLSSLYFNPGPPILYCQFSVLVYFYPSTTISPQYYVSYLSLIPNPQDSNSHFTYMFRAHSTLFPLILSYFLPLIFKYPSSNLLYHFIESYNQGII